MSATLTWRRTTAAKTGTTTAAFFTDIKAAVDAVSADANYLWQVASSSLAATPFYVVLKRKDGSAGRIMWSQWTSAPAGVNATILETTPNTSYVFVSYFPAGNTDTPLNLTAASGTILGDDTGAVKVANCGFQSSIYPASTVPYVWMSEEAVFLQTQNPANTTIFGSGAGELFVDKDDIAYPGTYGTVSSDWSSFGNTSGAGPGYVVSNPLSGSTTGMCRVNKNGASTRYYQAYVRSGSWGAQAAADSILYDGSTSKVWFDGHLMIPNIKGFGPDLKLRQIAAGPPSASSFQIYNTSLLTPAAICMQANSGANSGAPWFVNFKV